MRYARRWALSRNPEFYSFDEIGGDCTNFVSQCVYAGSLVMNFSRELGWYYISPDLRSPSWTSVRFFYEFITKNEGVGPYGYEAPLEAAEIGDVICVKLVFKVFCAKSARYHNREYHTGGNNYSAK